MKACEFCETRRDQQLAALKLFGIEWSSAVYVELTMRITAWHANDHRRSTPIAQWSYINGKWAAS